MWILDTSVAVKWFFTDEPGHAEAKIVLDRLILSPDDFAVPELFFAELAAVLIRKSRFDKAFVETAVGTVQELGIPCLPAGETLMKQAVAIACRNQMSYYDAVFLALAKELKGVWLTADQKALEKTGPSDAIHFVRFATKH